MAVTPQHPSPHTSTTTTHPSMLFHTVSARHYFHTQNSWFTIRGTCLRLRDLNFMGRHSRGLLSSVQDTGMTFCFPKVITFVLLINHIYKLSFQFDHSTSSISFGCPVYHEIALECLEDQFPYFDKRTSVISHRLQSSAFLKVCYLNCQEWYVSIGIQTF